MRITKSTELGALLLTATDLSNKRGGNQKLLKILGCKLYSISSNGKTWFFEMKLIKKLTVRKMEELTEKIKKEI